MSAHRVGANVVCDGPDDETDCPTSASFMDAVPAAQIRARLRREDGWTTGLPGGIDRCPACAKQAALATAPYSPEVPDGA